MTLVLVLTLHFGLVKCEFMHHTKVKWNWFVLGHLSVMSHPGRQSCLVLCILGELGDASGLICGTVSVSPLFFILDGSCLRGVVLR